MPGCGGPCVFFGQSTLLNTNIKQNPLSQEVIIKMRQMVQTLKKSTESRSDYENATDSANDKKSTESRSDHENVTDSINVKIQK